MADRSHSAIATLVDQLLEDPLVRLVMLADRIDATDASALLRTAALSVEWAGGAEEGALSLSDSDAKRYRQGVGVVLLNSAGRIFVAERIDVPGAWQMPQGGIDPGETPLEAALRELEEEVGSRNAEVLSETANWLRYDLPPERVGQLWGGRWQGQEQKWFAMLFKGDDREIRLDTAHPEFRAWRWATFEEAIDLTAPFKKDVYRRVASEFARLDPARGRSEEGAGTRDEPGA